MKSEILKKIAAHKPAPIELPQIPTFDGARDLQTSFIKVLEEGGGKAIFAQGRSMQDILLNVFPNVGQVLSTHPDFSSKLDLRGISPGELRQIEVAIIPARLGVAENAALYVEEKDMKIRILPFITQHLILVLNTQDIVGTMHEAYARIDLGQSGFSTFIAGPSKTADIEQSLVIGAQGSRTLHVILVS